MVCLVDTRATHNFIDQHLVEKCGLQEEDFFGFGVKVVDGAILGCTRMITQLNIQLGDYIFIDDFYVL